MRAEVDGQSDGRRSRPSSMIGPSGRAADPAPPEDEDAQSEWAKQEQQVCRSRYSDIL